MENVEILSWKRLLFEKIVEWARKVPGMETFFQWVLSAWTQLFEGTHVGLKQVFLWAQEALLVEKFANLVQFPGNEGIIFILALFLGYYVVSRVTPALHAPLMSLTNAVSSIVIIAAWIAIATSVHYAVGSGLLKGLGIGTIFLLGINIVGGLVITQRMLGFFAVKRQPIILSAKKRDRIWRIWRILGIAAVWVSAPYLFLGKKSFDYRWISMGLLFIPFFLWQVERFRSSSLYTQSLLWDRKLYPHGWKDVTRRSIAARWVQRAYRIVIIGLVLFTLRHKIPILSLWISTGAILWAFHCLSGLQTAKQSVLWGAAGMIGAALPFIFHAGSEAIALWVPLGLGGALGTLIAWRMKMTALPQLMAAFHSLVGLAAVFLAFMILEEPRFFATHISNAMMTELSLGAVIGAITFTGSMVAFGKLQGILGDFPRLSRRLVHSHYPVARVAPAFILSGILGVLLIGLVIYFVNQPMMIILGVITLLACLLGITLVLPVGGADMPVVVSLLNSYSGWAAAALGFSFHSPLLIIIGVVVGASGAILSYMMCQGMNRSLVSVFLGTIEKAPTAEGPARPVKSATPSEAAFMLANASSVIIVPGYGMAVAQAQHTLREIVDLLKNRGINVRYAIHPVAGRMPGHMNVLLAEAQIPYEDIYELEDINSDFANTDVVLVIGANDITNPSARDPNSPIYGMPILEVDKARAILFLKRSMATGYSGIDNPLFYNEKTSMVFGDAKKVCEAIVKEL